jgi:hypothetical protein
METVRYPSIDGLSIEADLYLPPTARHLVVLAHGITSERTEEGLYSAIASGLVEAGIAALAFDLRGHGGTASTYEQLTLTATLNDLLASIGFGLRAARVERFSIVSASFTGGIAIKASTIKGQAVSSLVLLNPRLDYAEWLTTDNYWSGAALDPDAASRLQAQGHLLVPNGHSLHQRDPAFRSRRRSSSGFLSSPLHSWDRRLHRSHHELS